MGIMRTAQLIFFIGFCLSLIVSVALTIKGYHGTCSEVEFVCDVLLCACSIGCTITTLVLR